MGNEPDAVRVDRMVAAARTLAAELTAAADQPSGDMLMLEAACGYADAVQDKVAWRDVVRRAGEQAAALRELDALGRLAQAQCGVPSDDDSLARVAARGLIHTARWAAAGRSLDDTGTTVFMEQLLTGVDTRAVA